MKTKLIFPIIILLLLSCEVAKNNKPKPIESVSALSSHIPISIPIVTPSVTPIASPYNLQPSPSPSWDCTIRSIDDYSKYMYEPTQYDIDYSVRLQGSIYDNKNQPIKDTLISLENEYTSDSYKNPKVSCSMYKFRFETKTDDKGNYKFEKILVGYYFMTISKKGMVSKRFRLNVYGTGYPGPCFNNKDTITFFSLKPDKNISCGYYDENLLLRTEPQISEVIINNIKINYSDFYSLPDPSIFNNNEIEEPIDVSPVVVKKDAKRSITKIIASEFVDIELIFSESIKKETIENNLQIISLEDSNRNLDKNSPNVFLKWADDNSRLNIKIKKLQDGKYRLAFKQSFEDIEGNKSLSKKYFYFSTYLKDKIFSSLGQSLYTENIVFEYKN